jgi:hypothetical protein
MLIAAQAKDLTAWSPRRKVRQWSAAQMAKLEVDSKEGSLWRRLSMLVRNDPQ